MSNKAFITNVVHIDTDEKDWYFPLHRHENEYELSLLLRGDLEYLYDNQEDILKINEILIKDKNKVHSEKGSNVEEICISIRGDIDFFKENYYPIIKADDFIISIFKFVADNKDIKAINEDLTSVLINLISSKISYKTLDNQKEKKELKETIYKVKEYIDDNYKDDIDLNKLSKLFYISPSYLSRSFKKLVGYSLNEYIVATRMGEAQKLLIYRLDLDIKDIAYLTGYRNIQYFYTQFKKYTKTTPSKYRNNFIKD